MQDFKLPSLPQIMLVVGKLLRTKRPESIEPSTKLEKCLTTRDLVSLGVGSCVGTGMYLVAGMVAKNVAGPAVIFSFAIAAIASLFSGVCYAEFGVRVPNTSGSAYMYSYVTVGEFVAFVIGWNMILEYLIGTAAGAAAISACIDVMYDGSIHRWMRSLFGTLVGHVPDLLAAGITVLMTFLLAAGVKKSLMFNNVLNVINFSVWIVIVATSLFYIDFDNWSQHGGFAPFGWSGVLNGAATCFYAFIGFDIIATTGEEAENPQRSIPTAIVSSLAIALTAYISSGLMVTLVVPYDRIDAESSLVEMFAYVGAPRVKLITVVGALAGLIVSMFGSMFPMPRVVYAMAKDGLLFEELAKVSPYTNTPVKATLIFGSLTAMVALVMSLEVLVEMMSIGTLMAYTLVSTCVLLLRYQPSTTSLVELLPQSIRSACPTPSKEYPPSFMSQAPANSVSQFTPQLKDQRRAQFVTAKRVNHFESSESEDTDINWSQQGSKDDEFLVPGNASYHYGSVPYQHGGSSSRRSGVLDKYEKLVMYLFPYGWKVNTPATEETGMFVVKLVGLFLVLVIVFDVLLAWHINSIQWSNHLTFFIFIALLISIVTIVLTISRQPQIRCNLKFKAPGVPFVPAIAIVINIYLILRLSILTLVRFIIWMTIGLFVYFCYGIKNSTLETKPNATETEGNTDNGDNKTNSLCPFSATTTTATAGRSVTAAANSTTFNTTEQCFELTIPNSRMSQASANHRINPSTNPFANALESFTSSTTTSTATMPNTNTQSVTQVAPKSKPKPKPKPPPIPPRPSLDRQSTSFRSQSSLYSSQQDSFEYKHKWETFE